MGRSRFAGAPRWTPAVVLAVAVAVAAAVAAVVAVPAPPTLAAANRPPVSAVTDPAALVHPMDGTGTGAVTPGTIGEFPGADLPFGMIQWSPDTSPNTVQSGGGYAYADSRINGFSLTHLSGTGCPSFQDVPVLPTVGALGADPETETDAFSHRDEEASPGRYQVSLDPGPVSVALSVTTRTGIARFAFPAGSPANLLFKVAGSVNPVTAASVQVVGRDEVVGQVSSGQFCGTGTNYTLHFVALFDRPFSSAGTWVSAVVSPGSSSCSGPTCGAFVTFDPSAGRDVLMKVGISFVSTADARQNLRAEDPGWSLSSVSTRAREAWNALLGRIAVSGGTPAEQHTFYTALYHSLLFPNVVSDVNGDYPGSDGKVHAASGRDEYADFSEWDVYRSEIQLESLLAPRRVGNMVQSLVDDAEQGGWLPKWAIVGGDEAQMNGDSADPIIADAYAMGARNFDVGTALRYMVKGATQDETGHGLEIERQYLDQYLTQHYVNAASLDLTSIDYSIGGSVTLEYAIDDFAIAQVAEAEHDAPLAAAMMPARLQLGVRVQPRDRVGRSPRAERELPSGSGVRGVAARAGRPDRVRGGQCGAVHLVGAPGPRSPGLPHGRRRHCREQARGVLHVVEREPRPTLRLVWRRARGMGPVGVRLVRRARGHAARRARHRRRRVRRRAGRRAGERRLGRHLVVVRLGGGRALPRDAGHRRHGPRQSPVPIGDRHAPRRQAPG